MLLISSSEDLMAVQMFVFLLVFFLILGLTHLWHFSWPHLRPSHSQGGALRTTVQRLLKPRTLSSAVRPAPAPVPIRCPYSRITEAHIHALVGDGTHGYTERIQTFRCQACHTTFTARRDTPCTV